MLRRNNKKQLEVDFLNLAVTIVTLLSLILGAVVIVQGSWKIAGTGLKLWGLNSKIQYYNESPRKTDEWTEECEQHFEERRQIYNSDDPVIRTFSTLPTIPKGIVWILSIGMILFTPLAVLAQFIKHINLWRARKKRRAKRNIARQEQCQRCEPIKARQFN